MALFLEQEVSNEYVLVMCRVEEDSSIPVDVTDLGLDDTVTLPIPLVIPVSPPPQACISSMVADDAILEGDEDLTFTVAGISPNTYGLVVDSPTSLVLNIEDNDGMCTTEWHGMYYIGCTSSFKDLLRYRL